MATYLDLFAQFDPPYETFGNFMLGPEFPAELDLVSRLWFRCGYRPGIAAYLNFFLLRDFITTHDDNYPPRFETFPSMAASFDRTDLFIRDVIDSGRMPTGRSPAPRFARRSTRSRSATSGSHAQRGRRPTKSRPGGGLTSGLAKPAAMKYRRQTCPGTGA